MSHETDQEASDSLAPGMRFEGDLMGFWAYNDARKLCRRLSPLDTRRSHCVGVWLACSSPATTTDVRGRDEIGVPSEGARFTGELALRRTIGFLAVSTSGTGPRGVPRINRDHRDSDHLGLVLDEGTELGKRPGRKRRPLGPANRYPITDAVQIFDGDPAPGAFGLGDDFLADNVIDVGSEAPLFFAALVGQSTGRASELPAKLDTQPAMATTERVHLRTGIDCTVAVGGDVHDPEVDAEVVDDLALGGFDIVDGREKIPLPVTQNQIAFALSGPEKFPLMLAANEGDLLASGHCPDRDALRIPAQNTVIIGNRAVGAKDAKRFSVELIGVRHFSDGANRHLGRQPEFRSNRVVDEFLKCVFAEGARLPRLPTDRVRCRVGTFQRGEKYFRLLRGWLEFHRGSQFHVPILAELGTNVKYRMDRGRQSS